MANSAADARASELEIRQKLIESKVVDVMVSIASNFFYTVTLPCTPWFFDKLKRNTDRAVPDFGDLDQTYVSSNSKKIITFQHRRNTNKEAKRSS